MTQKNVLKKMCKPFIIYSSANFACPRFLNPANVACPCFLGLAFVVPGSGDTQNELNFKLQYDLIHSICKDGSINH